MLLVRKGLVPYTARGRCRTRSAGWVGIETNMITLLFLSPAPHAGKTGLLAALSLRLAYQGTRVLALRLGDAADAAAAADARTFAALPFARGRGGVPVSVDEAGGFLGEGARPVD